MSLELGRNPWTCDCRLVWIRDWIRDIKGKSMPPTVMMTINNFNNIKSNMMLSLMSFSMLSSQHSSSSVNGSTLVSFREDNEVRLQEALSSLRRAKCSRSGKSLLTVFRKELRDCRRNFSPTTATSYLDSRQQVFQCISLLFFCHISFYSILN